MRTPKVRSAGGRALWDWCPGEFFRSPRYPTHDKVGIAACAERSRRVWRDRFRHRFSIPSGVAETNLRKAARYAGENREPLHNRPHIAQWIYSIWFLAGAPALIGRRAQTPHAAIRSATEANFRSNRGLCVFCDESVPKALYDPALAEQLVETRAPACQAVARFPNVQATPRPFRSLLDGGLAHRFDSRRPHTSGLMPRNALTSQTLIVLP